MDGLVVGVRKDGKDILEAPGVAHGHRPIRDQQDRGHPEREGRARNDQQSFQSRPPARRRASQASGARKPLTRKGGRFGTDTSRSNSSRTRARSESRGSRVPRKGPARAMASFASKNSSVRSAGRTSTRACETSAPTLPNQRGLPTAMTTGSPGPAPIVRRPKRERHL